jgi:hypothetical protein
MQDLAVTFLSNNFSVGSDSCCLQWHRIESHRKTREVHEDLRAADADESKRREAVTPGSAANHTS